MKTLTCIHAVVHLVVTGLSIFTQVARGWGFWESEGRWFIKRPPVFGLENPATRITQLHHSARGRCCRNTAPGQGHRLLDSAIITPFDPWLLIWMGTTSVHVALTPEIDMLVPRASARLSAPHPGRSDVSPPLQGGRGLASVLPISVLPRALWLCCLLLQGHLGLCRPSRGGPGLPGQLQVH